MNSLFHENKEYFYQKAFFFRKILKAQAVN